jgi:hypothetical protein
VTPKAMQRLRVISRELEARSTKGGPVPKFAFTAVRPLTAFWRSLQAVRHFGRGVADVCSVPTWKQLFQLWNLRMFHGYSAEEYYRYRMYRFSIDKAALFFPQGEYMALRPYLYQQIAAPPTLLADKRVFYRDCENAALPVPHTIADLEHGNTRWWREDNLPACDLFSKEACSIAGAGAAVWKWDGSLQRWTGGDGAGYDQKQLIQRLSNLSLKAPMIIQRRLTNHPELSDLGSSGVCTVRVVSIRSVESANPTILAATFRMPAIGFITDNFSGGGLASPVDLTCGRLGSAVFRDLSKAHVDVREHPASKTPIEGRILPMWPDVVELVLRAHTVYSLFPSVGWDVAITPVGPLLMEANYDWGVSLVQQPGSRPIGGTAYPEHVLSWLDAYEKGAK